MNLGLPFITVHCELLSFPICHSPVKTWTVGLQYTFIPEPHEPGLTHTPFGTLSLVAGWGRVITSLWAVGYTGGIFLVGRADLCKAGYRGAGRFGCTGPSCTYTCAVEKKGFLLSGYLR